MWFTTSRLLCAILHETKHAMSCWGVLLVTCIIASRYLPCEWLYVLNADLSSDVVSQMSMWKIAMSNHTKKEWLVSELKYSVTNPPTKYGGSTIVCWYWKPLLHPIVCLLSVRCDRTTRSKATCSYTSETIQYQWNIDLTISLDVIHRYFLQ